MGTWAAANSPRIQSSKSTTKLQFTVILLSLVAVAPALVRTTYFSRGGMWKEEVVCEAPLNIPIFYEQ
jgi:hypothetical protein